MIKQPINVDFDLNAKVSNSKLIAISHVDDKYNEVLEVNVRQNGAHIDLTGANVIARMVLHAEKEYLLNDNVPCTVSDSGNIMIPFDNAVVKTLQGIVKIEVSITRGEDKLTLQFPLWVSVNGSILDDAEVTPESEGTIPDLLKEAADALEDATEALERLGSYSNLEDKPQINSHTLDGNQSADDLGLQKKLTAGANILIDANGNISVTGVTKYKEELNYTQLDNCTENGVLYYTTIGGYDAFVVARNGFDHIRQFAIVGDKRLITRRKQKEPPYQPAGEWSAWEEIGGTDNYNDLSNKPQINSHTLDGNQSADDLGLQKKLTAGQNITIENDGTISASDGVTSYNDLTDKPMFNNSDIAGKYISDRLYIEDVGNKKRINLQNIQLNDLYQTDRNRIMTLIFNNTQYNINNILEAAQIIEINNPISGYSNLPVNSPGLLFCVNNYTQIYVTCRENLTDKTRMFVRQKTDFTSSWSLWQELTDGSQIVSGVVNQNGTITFTDSDGNTFTTSGASVIGPQGAPGDDYVLTAQDKTDIANIVLQLLPTTQGVLYGN